MQGYDYLPFVNLRDSLELVVSITQSQILADRKYSWKLPWDMRQNTESNQNTNNVTAQTLHNTNKHHFGRKDWTSDQNLLLN